MENEKLRIKIGQLFNYIRLETVKVGGKNLKMIRTEPLIKEIMDLFKIGEL